MNKTALFLCSEIQGAKCAYVQSDEINILVTDFDQLTTDAWFDYNIQKMTSISAGLASADFTVRWNEGASRPIAIFDSRVFNIPKEEVCNYFIWRQQDWVRNSVSMLAQAHFSHKELQGKNQPAMHEMLHAKGINWSNMHPCWKNGTMIAKSVDGWTDFFDIIFKDRRYIIEELITVKEQQMDQKEADKNLYRIARELTEEYFPQTLHVGDVVKHPSGRTVQIVDGRYMGEHGLSNFWEWQEVLTGGTLGCIESGYGWNPKDYEEKTEG
jgi:tRNA(His) 5'-end guanylyltransferase